MAFCASKSAYQVLTEVLFSLIVLSVLHLKNLSLQHEDTS